MGAKTWMLVLADSNPRDALACKPLLDRDATENLAKTLFPNEKLTLLGDGDLSFTCPPDNELHIGCFKGVSIVAAKEFGIDYPSTLPPKFIDACANGKVILHAMHSAVDWFAFAIWENGTLIRSLSLSPDSGILEDIGQHLQFEKKFWDGECPVDCDDGEDEYALPFHPLELGEVALQNIFGYTLEGDVDVSLIEPQNIPLIRFKRSKTAWWKFW